ncbi:MAG: AEC family transporter [Hyphomicrobiaceae bacterium]|nr:AEC family transporter [Hyphomicrobiaceae bacterium]
MDLFLDIAMKVTLPIVAISALGYIMQARINLDVASINRLLMNVVMPCFLVHFLSTAKQPIGEIWPTVYFTLAQFMVLIPLGWLAAVIFRLPAHFAPLIAMATVYANVGNYGIPLVQLAFPPEFILHQSVITSLMTMLMVTVGAWLLAPDTGKGSILGRVGMAFETPTIPAVMVGLTLRAFDTPLPAVIATPVAFLGATFPPLALYALGAQLATRTAGELSYGRLTLVVVLKLLVAPAVTWALAIAMGLPDDLADLMVVAAATPIGVLLALFCAEYNRDSKFMNSAILVSTALSPFTVTAWVLVTRLY